MVEMAGPRTSEAPGPLEGVRVLEFTQIVAGPVAGVNLSDLGADVIKVEPPEGEPTRRGLAVVPNEGKGFQALNRGKRSLAIDMQDERAQALMQRLVAGSDVVLNNYRLGVAERLGIDYETLRKAKPDLIYWQNTGFGEGGPGSLPRRLRRGGAGVLGPDGDRRQDRRGWRAGPDRDAHRRFHLGLRSRDGGGGSALPPRAHRRGAVPLDVAAAHGAVLAGQRGDARAGARRRDPRPAVRTRAVGPRCGRLLRRGPGDAEGGARHTGRLPPLLRRLPGEGRRRRPGRADEGESRRHATRAGHRGGTLRRAGLRRTRPGEPGTRRRLEARDPRDVPDEDGRGVGRAVRRRGRAGRPGAGSRSSSPTTIR